MITLVFKMADDNEVMSDNVMATLRYRYPSSQSVTGGLNPIWGESIQNCGGC